MLEKIDRWLLAATTVVVSAVVLINYITSYQHIYVLGRMYGEDGTDARLMPVGIDLVLQALAMVNVLAARLGKTEKKWRWALGGAVMSTVVANGAFGYHFGQTGRLIAMWSPVALFVCVEAGLFAFRIVAEYIQQQQEAAETMGMASAASSARARRNAASKASRERRKARQSDVPGGIPPRVWNSNVDNGASPEQRLDPFAPAR